MGGGEWHPSWGDGEEGSFRGEGQRRWGRTGSIVGRGWGRDGGRSSGHENVCSLCPRSVEKIHVTAVTSGICSSKVVYDACQYVSLLLLYKGPVRGAADLNLRDAVANVA